jgi:SAM-dependent methyltransferase
VIPARVDPTVQPGGGTVPAVPDDDILRHTAVNRAAWEVWGAVRGGNLRTAESFARGEGNFDPASLPIADWRGRDVLHLQCASGEDTLTLALAGALVTGVDFSASNIEHATSKAAAARIPARFVVADLYDLPAELTAGSFDVVFTGRGALVWLPDIRQWARVVASCLRPGGRLLLWEGHPIVDCVDVDDGRLTLNEEDYFNRDKPMRRPGGPPVPGANVLTQLTGVGDVASPAFVEFRWPVGDVVTAVAEIGMRIERLEEEGWNDRSERRLPSEVVARLRRLPTEYRLVARRG